MSFSGIYKIQSKIKPERIYIGSAVDLYNRWRIHKRSLFKNKHHSPQLQNHYNKYGEEDLIFYPLYFCSRDELIEAEQCFIDFFHPYFNVLPNARGTSGSHPSEETRKKLRDSHLGKKRPPMTQETKDKLSVSLCGNKNGRGNTGKKRTEKQKEIYSELTKRFFNTDDGIKQAEQNRILNTGIKQSAETIKKRVDKIKIIFNTPEYKILQHDIAKRQPNRICEYCGKDCIFPDYYIHHGEKCKLKLRKKQDDTD